MIGSHHVDARSRAEDLRRISAALHAADALLRSHIAGPRQFERKSGGDPVTAADRAVDTLLRQALCRPEEGWLSEESADDLQRLNRRRVWVVDPLDGTREFVAGIPEWCVSIALVEDGIAVAGGIANPQTGELFLGSLETGLLVKGNGSSRSPEARSTAVVLASRSEVKRGEWDVFRNAGFVVQPMGSVAYKLARVAAGLADATWTLVPKHEWDVAAGVALVLAAGGTVRMLHGAGLRFNRPTTRLDGLLAFSPGKQFLWDRLPRAVRRMGRNGAGAAANSWT